MGAGRVRWRAWCGLGDFETFLWCDIAGLKCSAIKAHLLPVIWSQVVCCYLEEKVEMARVHVMPLRWIMHC